MGGKKNYLKWFLRRRIAIKRDLSAWLKDIHPDIRKTVPTLLVSLE